MDKRKISISANWPAKNQPANEQKAKEVLLSKDRSVSVFFWKNQTVKQFLESFKKKKPGQILFDDHTIEEVRQRVTALKKSFPQCKPRLYSFSNTGIEGVTKISRTDEMLEISVPAMAATEELANVA